MKTNPIGNIWIEGFYDESIMEFWLEHYACILNHRILYYGKISEIPNDLIEDSTSTCDNCRFFQKECIGDKDDNTCPEFETELEDSYRRELLFKEYGVQHLCIIYKPY